MNYDESASQISRVQHSDSPQLTCGLEKLTSKIRLKDLELYAENVYYPTAINQFLEFWKRSTFIECLGLEIERNEKQFFKDLQGVVDNLALLRDSLLLYDMFMFLNGGTLLGWFRECSIIKHTTDVDAAVLAEEYNPEFLRDLFHQRHPFKIFRKLGKPDDSLEISVNPKNGEKINIDLYLMYSETNKNGSYSYVTGLSITGEEFIYTYPISHYNAYCSGDLGGHLFWVTCTPQKMLKHEYGKNWHRDFPSKNYYWQYSGSNIILKRKLSSFEMREQYKTY
ncbi:unnamed protein product [Caenorhabditis bovis]|uniref:LicD family protein n=1 Tax=Caenorhabditis bovis TaxID=2654633 RepID=A0A8S1EXD8_9PELO|nr:unnamed protein product [Caenorhabditis bovis]